MPELQLICLITRARSSRHHAGGTGNFLPDLLLIYVSVCHIHVSTCSEKVAMPPRTLKLGNLQDGVTVSMLLSLLYFGTCCCNVETLKRTLGRRRLTTLHRYDDEWKRKSDGQHREERREEATWDRHRNWKRRHGTDTETGRGDKGQTQKLEEATRDRHRD